ncbi:hypothetical protein [Streptomyces griseus]|uniref:hypothetical protein n=1 Tax=Streptomyces griseus TaxID=1911 RepID=UPI000A919081|nr:hypothetical protein [Streptomyces griseus]
MSTAETKVVQPRPYALPGVSMRDLLASCAAAHTISTPPRVPDPGTMERTEPRRKAA